MGTLNLAVCVWQHKNKINSDSSNKSNLDKLVYYKIDIGLK